MKHTYFLPLLILLLATKLNSAQDYCSSNRFEDAVFSDGEIEQLTNIIYGSAINNQGIEQQLVLDLYFPDTLIDDLSKRPVIMYVHGGGLTGGSKDGDGASDMGLKFAQHGFVFASIEYRLGWMSGEPDSCDGNIDDYYRAQYWGVQDTKAAIRFLKEKASEYQIDTNYFFGSGTSAGSNLILYAAYADQNNFYEYLRSDYGSIDSSGNDFFHHSCDMTGLILESAGLEDSVIFYYKTIPSIYFHGTCDGIIPFFEGPMFFCSDPVAYPYFYGGWAQTQFLEHQHKPYHFYIGEGGAHDVAPPDTIVYYGSAFCKELFCDDLKTTPIYRIVGKAKCAVENDGNLFIEPVYPNPVDDQIGITVTSSRDREVELYIFNSMGQAVKEEILTFYPPLRTYSIDVSGLAHGVYFMVVSQRQEIYMIQFVK